MSSTFWSTHCLLGKGTRLFDGMDDRVNLRRLDVESFDSGIVKTVYQRA